MNRPFTWPDLRDYEEGRSIPPLPIARAIIRVYGRTLDELLSSAASPNRSAGRARSSATISSGDPAPTSPPPEVTALWARLGIAGALTAGQWVAAGWDPLECVVWVLVGFDPSLAERWQLHGFTPFDARALDARGDTPEDAGAWAGTGLASPMWPSWRRAGFDSVGAASFVRAGFDAISAAEAAEWRAHGFDGDSVAAYRSLGVDAASSWRSVGIAAADVPSWVQLGLGPHDVERWQVVSEDAATIRHLIDLDVGPAEALQWLSMGVGATRISEWRAAGFGVEGAGPWVGTSAARARRLAARGISAEIVRQRAEAGAARVNDARAAMAQHEALVRPAMLPSAPAAAQRPMRGPRPSSQDQRGDNWDWCRACGRSIGVNGLCGCS